MHSVRDSLSATGYLRSQKAYTPPADVEVRIAGIVEKYAGSNDCLRNGRVKFKVLEACCREFGRSVPNSRLHEVFDQGEFVF